MTTRQQYIHQTGRVLQYSSEKVYISYLKVVILTLVFLIMYTMNPNNILSDHWYEAIRKTYALSGSYGTIGHLTQRERLRRRNIIRAGMDYTSNYAHDLMGRPIQKTNSNVEHADHSFQDKARNFLGPVSWKLFGIELNVFSTDASGYKMFPLSKSIDKTSSSSAFIHETFTSFGFFVLRKDSFRGKVSLGLLLHWVPVCHYRSNENNASSEICSVIADNVFHGMAPFDDQNYAYTAHRVLSCILLLSYALSCCTESHPTKRHTLSLRKPIASPFNLMHRPLCVFFSTFFNSALLEDLILLNLLAYPPLLTMSRTILGNTTFMNLNPPQPEIFYLNVMFLYLVLGGLANTIASYLKGSGSTFGFKGGVAAMLGYQVAISSSTTILHFRNWSLTASELLGAFSMLASLSLYTEADRRTNNIGTECTLYRGWTGSSLVTWVVGGVLGNLLGKYHADRFNVARWWFR